MKIWGYAAASWCLLFAALHVFWALGGTVGLAESAGADLATQRPAWFVLGGLWGVALVLLVGAWFSVGLTRWRPHRLVTALGWLGGAALLLRGAGLEVALLTTNLSEEVGEQQTRWSLLLWNPWFMLGGAFLLAATYLASAASRRGSRNAATR
ncbi:DUF3995 domain-containing protein [Lentzea sp. NPDC051213]|uniref:DUF3995 domain-containing protein n=1 Tax=Lentzea sp. NPDC051213 TaxID=3364126 RepID=UPI00378A2647